MRVRAHRVALPGEAEQLHEFSDRLLSGDTAN